MGGTKRLYEGKYSNRLVMLSIRFDACDVGTILFYLLSHTLQHRSTMPSPTVPLHRLHTTYVLEMIATVVVSPQLSFSLAEGP